MQQEGSQQCGGVGEHVMIENKLQCGSVEEVTWHAGADRMDSLLHLLSSIITAPKLHSYIIYCLITLFSSKH